HAVAVVGQPHDLPASPDVGAELGRPGAEYRLGARLREPAGTEVAVLEHRVVERDPAEVADRAGFDVAEPWQEPALVEHLHRPGGEAQTAGLPGGFGELLQDDDLDTAETEFGGQDEPGGARTHDDDRCIHDVSPR